MVRPSLAPERVPCDAEFHPGSEGALPRFLFGADRAVVGAIVVAAAHVAKPPGYGHFTAIDSKLLVLHEAVTPRRLDLDTKLIASGCGSTQLFVVAGIESSVDVATRSARARAFPPRARRPQAARHLGRSGVPIVGTCISAGAGAVVGGHAACVRSDAAGGVRHAGPLSGGERCAGRIAPRREHAAEAHETVAHVHTGCAAVAAASRRGGTSSLTIGGGLSGVTRVSATVGKHPPARKEPAIVGYTPDVARVLGARNAAWFGADIRIAVSHRGAVRLRPDGPVYGLADGAAFPSLSPMAVLDDTERPRVVTNDPHVRMLVVVDRGDAQPVVVRPAPLLPTARSNIDDPPRHGYVELQRGAWVDLEAQQADHARVTIAIDAHGENQAEALSGWVHLDALGTTAAAPGSDDQDTDEERWFVTKRTTKLRERPGARKALVGVAAKTTVVALTAGPKAGARLVKYRPFCERNIAYVGFVAARDLQRQPNAGGLGFCGIRTFPAGPVEDATSAPRTTLSAGRFVLDPDEPRVVGCVLQPSEVADLGEGLYAIPTIWGPIPVRLAPESFEGPCGGTRSQPVGTVDQSQ